MVIVQDVNDLPEVDNRDTGSSNSVMGTQTATTGKSGSEERVNGVTKPTSGSKVQKTTTAKILEDAPNTDTLILVFDRFSEPVWRQKPFAQI